ncbi:MAG: PepSY-associated TM helix domain-containing protein [Sphingomonas sp.]
MSKARTRQFWTKIHRYLGLATLVFLFFAAVTGCFLCFDKVIDAGLNPDLFRTSSTGPTIDPAAAATRLETERPQLAVLSFPLHVPPGRTIEATVGPRDPAAPLGYDQVFLDPHDGHAVGTRQSGPGWDRRHIVEGVFEFHYTLLAGTWGRWLMGIAALGWLIGNGVGFYLTLPPAGPFWRKWKPMWTIDWSARLRRMMLDIHRASGLWLLLGAMVLAYTSVAMNFFDEAFTPVAQALSPARASPFDRPATGAAKGPPIGFAAALDRAVDHARAEHLGWQPAKVSQLPDRNLYGVMFTKSGVEHYRGLGPVTYYIDGASGRFVYADDPYHDSTGRKFSRALYPLHSGEVIGPIGIAIIFILGLSTAEMCVTGLYTWWKKRQSRLAGERAKRLAKAAA